MLYRIALIGGHESLRRSETRKRADAASLLAARIAYDVIAGHGGLDTAQGWAAYNKVRAIDPRRGGSVVVYDHTLVVTPCHV